MKKRFLSILIALVISVLSVVTLASCGDKICEHTFDNGACTLCGASTPSEGLKYKLASDGDYYIVSSIGTCTDTKIVIPATYNGMPVYQVGVDAFKNNTKITEVEIHEGVRVVNPYAFKGCTNLKSVSFPKTLTDIDWCSFENCTALTKVDIPDRVSHIEFGAFRGCSSLVSVKLGSKLKTLGAYAFAHCSSIYAITIPSSIKEFGDRVFVGCNKLIEVYNKSKKKITVGSTDFGGVAEYAKNVYKKKNGSKLFTDENGFVFYLSDTENYLVDTVSRDISNLVLPASVKGQKYSIYQYAFLDRKDILTVENASGVLAIGNYAFNACTNLSTAEFGDDLTSIGDGAFYLDRALSSFAVGKNLSSIGKNAFMGCSVLMAFNFGGSTSDWSGVVKGDLWNSLAPFKTIVCNNGEVDAN